MRALAVTAMVVMALLAGAVSWFAVRTDPLGGQPSAMVVLDPLKRPEAPPAAKTPPQGRKPSPLTATAIGAATTPGQVTAPPAAAPGLIQGLRLPPGLSIAGQAGLEPVVTGKQASKPIAMAATSEQVVELPPVPVAALVETSRYGPLPKVADDGRLPSQAYSRPSRFSGPAKEGEPVRVAILVGGLGLSELATSEAIKKLPGPVTLAFSPYGRNLQGWIHQARRAGHEVMLQIPLEPFDYPDNDPGPHTLLTRLPTEENLKRLRWLMARFTGYPGITNHMGSKFTSAQEAFLPVLQEVKSRGLIYLDDGTSSRSTAGQIATDLGLGFSSAQIVIDARQSPADIEQALAQLEAQARENGLAIGVGSSLPITVERIITWSKTLPEKGMVLIPVSAAVSARRQT